jgi:UDP-N-acetylmuramyl pentapeptide synthase
MFFWITMNKLITKVCHILGKNGAQLPGYFVYDVFKRKNILEKVKYPQIVIAVTGSSGKGTTCSILKHILEDANLTVSYNDSGNNGILGVTTHILNNCDNHGHFEKQVLILECDERHLKLIFRKNKPTYLIVTNITRDQPARNGNPEIIFNEISKCLDDSIHLIINADDPLVNRFKLYHHGPITTYGISKTKDDYEVNTINNVDFAYCPVCHKKLVYTYYHYGHLGNYHCPNNDFSRGNVDFEATMVDLPHSKIIIDNKEIKLTKNALYNVYATLASYACASIISIPNEAILYALNQDIMLTKRGRTEKLGNRNITMLESKNENNLSYYQSIKYIINEPGLKTIILGFDNVSRRYKLNDLSWLYDVNFELLANNKQVDKIFCIGRFRYDVATRLNYAGIERNKIILIDDLNNLLKEVETKSSGNIYTMVCFDMTSIIKKLVQNENN